MDDVLTPEEQTQPDAPAPDDRDRQGPVYDPRDARFGIVARSVALVTAIKARIRVRRRFSYPLAVKGRLIGFPGQGTHSWHEPPNNWQSDNAIDIGTRKGTAVLAVEAGTIGNRIGPLPGAGPRFQGIRVYVDTNANSFYYAHLSRLARGIRPGAHVRAGQLVGFSGVANGSPHLHFASQRGNPAKLVFRKG
jgi:murein DD-endopeptidase MepM/ murein hydrolase activator NlpD